jgi:methanogenic corrinoid protein MtbC1
LQGADRIIQAIVVQDKSGVLELVTNALNVGIDPMVIVNQALVAGLRTVGDLFAEEEIFLPELVYCGEIVTGAMENLQNLIQGDERRIEKKGLMLVGTVSGDVHDIGLCHECLMKVNGVANVQTCQTLDSPQTRVETQK